MSKTIHTDKRPNGLIRLTEAASLLKTNPPGTCGQCACRLQDGRCHRFPPVYTSGWGSSFPTVDAKDLGCFEFREA